jgi:hypothetical protein
MRYRDLNKHQPAVLIVEMNSANKGKNEKMNDVLAVMKQRGYSMLDLCIVGVEHPYFQIFSSDKNEGRNLSYWLEWPLTAALKEPCTEVDEMDMEWLNNQAFYVARPEEMK